jgi:hypothetical protein
MPPSAISFLTTKKRTYAKQWPKAWFEMGKLGHYRNPSWDSVHPAK